MQNNKSVIVGMSGGVDSSLTAYLLKEQGYEVEGVSLILFDKGCVNPGSKSPCCSVETATDAMKTARSMGVKHTCMDMRDEFAEKVIRPFIEAYKKGLTPNPCILCNRHIKFPSLIKAADEKGFNFIATGHYARVDNEVPRLMRGVDTKKDQSYVLYSLPKEIIRRLVLPLGEKTKIKVSQIATSLEMAAAHKPESQEICFIEAGNYIDFMKSMGEAAESEGNIVDIESGKVLARHSGIHHFTIGQRKRLPATGKPIYVVKVDTLNNAVYIGPKELAMKKAFMVERINWLTQPEFPRMRATVKVRSTMKDEPAWLTPGEDGTVEVEFDEPQWAPAPGQSAVFYDGDFVLGGGVIQSSPDARKAGSPEEIKS
jgi:tRNA-uridine 2-sulfurtransferase